MLNLRAPFLLLLLVPALWGAWRAVYRWGIPGPRPSRPLARLSARTLPPLLAALLVLAAAGPEWRRTVAGRAPVVDFAVVLDGSSSMKAMDDGRTDRWTSARQVLKAFIAGRPDDRFSGGLGAAVSRRVSFDLAFDLGRTSRVLSASLFYRF